MTLEIKIEDIDLQMIIAQNAQNAGLSVNEYATTMFLYSFNSAQAVYATEHLISLLQGPFLEKMTEIQINSYAVRHQITNLHADLLGDNEQRALDIATEANELAIQSINEETSDEK